MQCSGTDGVAILGANGWTEGGLPHMAEDTVLPEDGAEGWSCALSLYVSR
jgi:nitrogen fixation protein